MSSMLHKNKLKKLLISIIAIGSIIWIGGLIIRGVIAYDIFETVDNKLAIKSLSSERIFSAIYYFSAVSVYIIVSYMIVFISIIILNTQYYKKLKKMGWLFMALILFYISMPIEIYRFWFDYNLSLAVFQAKLTDISNSVFKEYFFRRYENPLLTTFFSLSLMSNLTSILLVIWQPLQMDKTQGEENEN